jgi:hypothetical protein
MSGLCAIKVALVDSQAHGASAHPDAQMTLNGALW